MINTASNLIQAPVVQGGIPKRGSDSESADVPQDLFTLSSPTPTPAASLRQMATAQATATAQAPAAEQLAAAPNLARGAGSAMGLNSPAVAAALDQLAALGGSEAQTQAAPPQVETSAGTLLKIDPEQAKVAQDQVNKLVGELVNLDPDSADFRSRVEGIQAMGRGDIDKSANVSRGILSQSLNSMKKNPASASVGEELSNLRTQLNSLSPDRVGGIMSRIPLIGRWVGGVEKYARDCQSAQSNIEGIDTNLQSGRTMLHKDNEELQAEIVGLRGLTKKVSLYTYATKLLDVGLGKEIEKMKKTDPEKAQRLENDCQFYVRQKNQDLMTQLAVNMQGELVLGTIRKNNDELIKGVDRARTTTMSAFRTGVIAAITLDRQKKVLDGVNALNKTTGDLIAATGRQLNEQGKGIREQATKAVVDPAKINEAFQSIFQCLNDIDTFKAQAMDDMGKTINVLSTNIDEARVRADRLKNEQQNDNQTQNMVKF